MSLLYLFWLSLSINVLRSDYVERYYESLGAILYCYGILESPISGYEEASDHCKETGGRLVEIKNERQQKNVEKFLEWDDFHYTGIYLGMQKKNLAILTSVSKLQSIDRRSISGSGKFLTIDGDDKSKLQESDPHYFICFYKKNCVQSNGCFKEYEINLNWYEARNHCVKEGGDLASVDRNFEAEKFPRLNKTFWLGYSQIRWYWKSEPDYFANYSNWGENDYSDYNYDYKCAMINSDSKKWMRISCDEFSDVVICMKAVSNATDTVRTGPSKTDKIVNSNQNPFLISIILAGISLLFVFLIIIVMVMMYRKVESIKLELKIRTKLANFEEIRMYESSDVPENGNAQT